MLFRFWLWLSGLCIHVLLLINRFEHEREGAKSVRRTLAHDTSTILRSIEVLTYCNNNGVLNFDLRSKTSEKKLLVLSNEQQNAG